MTVNKYFNKAGVCLLYLALFFMGIPQYISGKESKQQQHVLVFSSYFPDKENSSMIIASFSHKLRAELNCRISVEYMDSESSTDFRRWKNWMLQSFDAYEAPPDVVVIIGSEGWDTYMNVCPQQWKNIPVVLGFMKSKYINYSNQLLQDINLMKELRATQESFGDFRVTGYYVEDYFYENLQLIRRLQPEVRHISYIYDNRYGFEFWTPYMEKLVKEAGFESLHPFYGNQLTTSQLVDSLVSQDSSYAFLSSGWYTDVRHYPHSYSMLHNALSDFDLKYFYLIMDQGQVNQDYIGGYFVSAGDIGKDLAELTYDVLTKGIENSPEFQRTPSSPQYYIDYNVLKSSGIDESLLPPDTILYNEVPSLLKTYFWQLFVISILSLSLLAFLLLWLYHYKRIAGVKARMAKEQVELRKKADEANRLKSTFLANMSHEIRTPLNAIVGFSSQLAYTEDKEEMKEYIGIIKTNNGLLLQLINDILDMSKIEAGYLDFVYSQTDIVELCHNLKYVYMLRVKEGVELICNVPDESFVIRTDQNRLTQVISNFLSNAVKFTEKGYIRFGYEHVKGGLRFYSEDTGKGIAPENLSRVFMRFEKFDEFVKGNGLGMSISKSIVERMNGQIGVDSEPGKGSTFWFILPDNSIES